MNELKVITSERFETHPCDFFSGGEDYWMTREQIGTALEYSNPSKAIKKIHNMHRERLDMWSCLTRVVPKSGPPSGGGAQNTMVYSRKGVMEICRYSHQPKADDFMDFAWEVMDRLMRGDARLIASDASEQLSVMRDWMQIAGRKIEGLDSRTRRIEKGVGYLNYYHRRQAAASKDIKWMLLAKRKFKAIAKYLCVDERKVLTDIYVKMEDTFRIDLNMYQADYNFKYASDKSSRLNVIDDAPELRDMFDTVVDDLVMRYGIEVDLSIPRRNTIFDGAIKTA